ncbi:MAG: transcription factor E [Candidatus Hodarchaeales archaeon]
MNGKTGANETKSSPISSDALDKILERLFGEESVIVAKTLLSETENFEITDEEIANRTELPLKTVRRTLYRLNEWFLARYRRERDNDTGYFVYNWSLATERLEDLVSHRKSRTLQLLQQRLDYEERHLLYSCGNVDCPQLLFGEAFEHGFICPQCNESLAPQDNKDTIEFLKAQIKKITDWTPES